MRGWGFGPVFALEWRMLSRRWSTYALRSGFVGMVLLGLTAVWWSEVAGSSLASGEDRARVGLAFFRTIVAAEFIMVLALAPASTAGAIAREKDSGHLALILLTDLSNFEIILGKMAAWLLPGIGLVIGTLPVAAIGTLLGGIDPWALTAATLIAVALAILGASLAMTLSVWGTRMHEVLLVVYGLWAVWLLSVPAWFLFTMCWGIVPPPEWLGRAHPFWLAFAPYERPGKVGPFWVFVFLFGCVAISGALAAVAAWRVRAVAIRQIGGVRRAGRGHRSHRFEPTLDRDPLAWRERHRGESSPWRLALVAGYAIVSAGFTAATIVDTLWFGSLTIMPSSINAYVFALGMPVLGVWSASSLAEDRRGRSLDVLLTTPMSSTAIVWSKWWASARQIGWVVLLPGLVAAAIGWETGHLPRAALLVALLAAIGAALVGLGLAIATVIERPGRAVAADLAVVIVLTVGWSNVSAMLFEWPTSRFAALGSPFDAAAIGTNLIIVDPGDPLFPGLYAMAAWTFAYAALAGLLFLAAIVGMERSLGRLPDRPRRPRLRPPRVAGRGWLNRDIVRPGAYTVPKQEVRDG